MEHDDRAARQASNLVRHLNQSYPDTVLFLARHAGVEPEATFAELMSVTDTELLFRVTKAGTVEPMQVPLPSVGGTDGDVRARVRELLRHTRLSAPDVPLTSLEQQTGGGSGRHG